MTTPASLDETRQWLLDGAATLEWPQIWARLAAARAALVETTLDVNEAQALWTPDGPDSSDPDDEEAWCIAQVMRHLITATPNVADIIEATAQGRANPKDPPGAIAADPASAADLRRDLVRVSERLLSVGLRLPDPIDAEVTVDHAFFGPLPCKAWPLFQSVHDGLHTAQINALKASDGYPS